MKTTTNSGSDDRKTPSTDKLLVFPQRTQSLKALDSLTDPCAVPLTGVETHCGTGWQEATGLFL